MAWKLDDLFKAIGNAVQGLTATAARLIVDVAWAIIPPSPRRWRRRQPMLAADIYTPLVLRVLLYAVLIAATLLYYGRREDLTNLVSFGLTTPQIDAAADGFLWRGDAPKVGASIGSSDANPGGEITQALASQNLTQFLSSAAVVALVLLILFEVAYLLGRWLVSRGQAGFEREVFVYSGAGILLFGLYLWLLWGPFLEDTGQVVDGRDAGRPAHESTTLLAWLSVEVWDRIAGKTAEPPADPRRFMIVHERWGDWIVLLVFFAIPAWLCFLRLIQAVRFRVLAGFWHWLRPRAAAAMTPPGVRALRRAIVIPASNLMGIAAVVASLFGGCFALVHLAHLFDPSRNLTIEGVNFFPDPQGGQNGQLLTFLLRNGMDHPIVLGLRGPRVTIRLPAREQCEDPGVFVTAHETYRRELIDRAIDAGGSITLEQAAALNSRYQDMRNRTWLPPCQTLRRVGVEIVFDLVAIGPPAGNGVMPTAEQAQRTARIVPAGTSVVVVARERLRGDPNMMIRCGFERLMPTPSKSGPLNELMVRVAIVGGRQVVSSGFRRYPAALMQPTATMGEGAVRQCGEPLPPPPVAAAAASAPPSARSAERPAAAPNP